MLLSNTLLLILLMRPHLGALDPCLCKSTKIFSSSASQSARIQPELSKLFGFQASSSTGRKRRRSSCSFSCFCASWENVHAAKLEHG